MGEMSNINKRLNTFKYHDDYFSNQKTQDFSENKKKIFALKKTNSQFLHISK